jgi:transposase
MRVTSLLKKLLGIKFMVVSDVTITSGVLVIDIRVSWRYPRCCRCKKVCPGYDELPVRKWRHLDFGGVLVFLRYSPRRVECPEHGVVEELVSWSDDPISRYTLDFEDQIAYSAQRSDKTTVSESFRIAWRTVGSIIERVVRRKRPGNLLKGLRRMGVDELSYRKQHHYVTLVTDHATGRIIWGAEGKGADTLKKFFKELGSEGCKDIDVVTMDMSAAYISAATEAVPGVSPSHEVQGNNGRIRSRFSRYRIEAPSENLN